MKPPTNSRRKDEPNIGFMRQS